MRLLVGAALSLAVHAAIVAGVALMLAPADQTRTALQPLEVLPAPEPPPPPQLPPPEPPPQPPPKPRPKKVRKPHISVVADGGIPDAGPAEDAAVEADAGPDGGALDGGAADGGADGGAADAGAPVDPGVVDLRPFVPPGERVMLVLRTDRLRGTPWAERLEALVAPMPDHRLVLDGTGLDVAAAFDVVVISSAEPRDVTRTFLAARSGLDEDTLRRALARPAPGTRGPRLRWSGNVAERLDPRVAQLADPRRLAMPMPGWFVLVRPEHLEEGHRAWLEALAHVDEQTGGGPTLAVLMVADLGKPTLQLPLPGVPPLPAPERMTVALSADPGGLVVTGAAHFADEATAGAFADTVEKARDQALASFGGKVILRTFHAEGAARRLAFARHGDALTFSTSLANDEAAGLLEQAAEMSRQFFLRPSSPK